LSEMSFAEFNQLFAKYFVVSGRFSQTHSEGYRRHLEMLREVNQRLRPIRFSRLLRMEAKIRELLGRSPLDYSDSLSPVLGRAVPGDYVIEPLQEASSDLLTFIFVGKRS
ncbi:MAG TPA: hypothetical protein VJS64_18375, partial [Pyrinomonadaceae bacterium]|nr:hypothetical protein [Pyrinomonadaceae bacterium]